MGLAIDTIGTSRTTGGSADTTFQANAVASGDTLTVRNFNPPATAFLERLFTSGPSALIGRVRSPAFHDNVEGVQVYAGEEPMRKILPYFARQQLRSQDQMVAEMIGKGVTTVNMMSLAVFYSDLPGVASRLHTWEDIANLIVSIKYMRVTQAAGGAAAAWLDTVLNATENLLQANTDYAVLGYITDTAEGIVAIKGADTGNLRIGGPSVLDSDVTSEYFVRWSKDVGGPRIPVINAANVNNTFSSAFSNAAPASTTNVQWLLAQLAHPI